jgi:hypothetical protein
VTVQGEISVQRGYYYCKHCRQGSFPWDEVVGVEQGLSHGLRSLVCLAGALAPFEDAAEDIVRRFAGVRLSASTVLRATEEVGQRLQTRLDHGRVPKPTVAEAGWKAPREGELPAAYVGVDAFSVPMQGPDGAQADHRMLYAGVLYTPDKEHSRYVVDFDLDQVVTKLRRVAAACGVGEVSQLIAVTDGGNGIEEALRRGLADNLRTILDWYHAAQHVHAFGHVCFGAGSPKARAWNRRACDLLYEQGGTGLLAFLRRWKLPTAAPPEAVEEFRKLQGYFENNEHRTDYPTYRAKGWDIGSGPTEAGCKIIGERLKGSGMRWVEKGAEAVGALRALYVSGAKLWDGFWASGAKAA